VILIERWKDDVWVLYKDRVEEAERERYIETERERDKKRKMRWKECVFVYVCFVRVDEREIDDYGMEWKR